MWQYTVDAAGRNSRTVAVTIDSYHDPDSTVWGSSVDLTQSFDGDGNKVKRLASDTTIDYTEGNTTTTTMTYLVRSSVLNQVLTELSETGEKQRTFVYLGSAVLAWQRQSLDNSQTVLWEHRDPGNASYRATAGGGGLAISQQSAELDPLGNDAGLSNPIPNPQHKQTWSYPGFGDTGMSGDSQCILDGDFQPCSLVFRAAAAGGLSSMDVPWSISGTVPNRTPVWVPDNSKDKWIPDPEHGIGTYVIGDGGHYEWVPTGDVTTSIQSRQPQNLDHRLTQDEYSALRKGIAAALQSERCKNFIEALVFSDTGQTIDAEKKLLPYSDTVFGSKEGGIFFRPRSSGDTERTSGYPRIIAGDSARPDLNVLGNTNILMHQLIHQITNSADDILSRELRDLHIVPLDRDGVPLPFPTGKIAHDNSYYFDRAIITECFPKARF